MAVGAVLIVWWFLALSTSQAYFAFVDGLLTSLLGDFVMFCLLVTLWYHLCNGVRHLVWDTGAGFSESSVNRSAIAGLCGTILLTAGSLALIHGF